MGCASCGTSKDGKPSGCKSNGGCSSGGCNKRNTYNWLADYECSTDFFDTVEISFKKGTRKDFYKNPIHAMSGDMVVVETDSGVDVGQISLSGELVKAQMKKKRVKEDSKFKNIKRIASEEDLEKLLAARSREKDTIIKGRKLIAYYKLDMKLGDVEFQADGRKCTFYYTANGRVDFRELIKEFAREFKVKVEMKQIGARQESALIGGVGACGRELCCSTWLSDFKSVSTVAARYQNLSINQTKLSGQCGRLKCCLNYELDTYMDALDDFPVKADYLKTEAGTAQLIKTDVFKGVLFYVYKKSEDHKIYPLSVDRVKEIQEGMKTGKLVSGLKDYSIQIAPKQEEEVEFADVTGQIELKNLPKRKKKRNNRKKKNQGGKPKAAGGQQRQGKPKSKPKQGQKPTGKQGQKPKQGGQKPKPKQGQQPKSNEQASKKNSDPK